MSVIASAAMPASAAASVTWAKNPGWSAVGGNIAGGLGRGRRVSGRSWTWRAQPGELERHRVLRSWASVRARRPRRAGQVGPRGGASPRAATRPGRRGRQDAWSRGGLAGSSGSLLAACPGPSGRRRRRRTGRWRRSEADGPGERDAVARALGRGRDERLDEQPAAASACTRALTSARVAALPDSSRHPATGRRRTGRARGRRPAVGGPAAAGCRWRPRDGGAGPGAGARRRGCPWPGRTRPRPRHRGLGDGAVVDGVV